jgi:signal transduction histidine kinase
LKSGKSATPRLRRNGHRREPPSWANLDTLALAVWGFDERVMNVTAASLVRGTSIFHVEVIEDGKPVVTVDRPGTVLNVDYAWEVPLLRPNSSERIGTLRISESYDDVRAQLERRSAALIAMELTKILATSILLFFIAYFLVARPLRQLAQKVQSVEPGDRQGPISVPRSFGPGRDEIESLIDAINASNATRQQMETEQRRHQLREANAGKLEALGQLAGGIAHDFNNLLGAILGFAGLLKDDLSDRPEQRRFAQRILTACDRGKELIEQIRTFARAETTEHKVVDLGRVVRQNVTFLSASLPKTTRLTFRHTGEELPVAGSEALLGQILANLCINASEALEGKPGDIRVTLERCGAAELEKMRAPAPGSDERFIGQIVPGREYACLRVSDTAGGIPETIMDRMFDPFFHHEGTRTRNRARLVGGARHCRESRRRVPCRDAPWRGHDLLYLSSARVFAPARFAASPSGGQDARRRARSDHRR